MCQVKALLVGATAGAGLLRLSGTSAADALAYGGALAGTSALCAAIAVLAAQFVTTAPAARTGAGPLARRSGSTPVVSHSEGRRGDSTRQ